VDILGNISLIYFADIREAVGAIFEILSRKLISLEESYVIQDILRIAAIASDR